MSQSLFIRSVAITIFSGVVMLLLPGIGKGATLSLEDRIDCQRAVDQVRWEQRIWPDDNPGPKPSLSAVVPDEVLRERAEDAVLKSRALEVHWQRALRSEHLQAEIDRMVRETRDPETLRSLFAALGDDPELVAECLARPSLAERMVRSLYAGDERIHGQVRDRAESELASARTAADLAWLGADYEESRWVLANDASSRRPESDVIELDEATWHRWGRRLARSLGQEFQGAGADDSSDPRDIRVGSVGRLQESRDAFYARGVLETGEASITVGTVRWEKRSFDEWWGEARPELEEVAASADRLVSEPQALESSSYTLPSVESPTAVSKSAVDPDPEGDGWWRAVPGGKIGPRHSAVTVWTGNEVLIFGGFDGSIWHADGAIYSPATDTWGHLPVSTSLQVCDSGPYNPKGVWTGEELIVVASEGCTSKFSPTTETWNPADHLAHFVRATDQVVWDGSHLFLWGVWLQETFSECFQHEAYPEPKGTVAYYSPESDSWTEVPWGAGYFDPDEFLREDVSVTAVDGTVVIWGGRYEVKVRPEHTCLAPEDEWRMRDDGLRYRIFSGWSVIPDGGPSARALHSAVWTGDEMIVWGGWDDGKYRNSGAAWDPDTGSWRTITNTNNPTDRARHTAVWTGSEMIVWGGKQGNTHWDTGGRYDPVADSWSTMATVNAPSGRVRYGMVWTGSEVVVWGGENEATGTQLDSGGRYDPATNTWSPTSTPYRPAARSYHAAVSTGAEILIWGGLGASGELGDGAKFYPATATWMPISGSGAPAARRKAEVVWNGSEAILYGGRDGSSYLASGGRYSPSTDQWDSVPSSGSPSGRTGHTLVWTGTEAVVWGGWNGSSVLGTGARFAPGDSSWTALPTIDAPTPRTDHSAVWTGDEMIVFGGTDGGGSPLATGSAWSPGGWDAIAPANSLTTGGNQERSGHVALWSDIVDRMVVLGGVSSDGCVQQYDPATDDWSITDIGSSADCPEDDPAGGGSDLEVVAWDGDQGLRYNLVNDVHEVLDTSGAPADLEGFSGVWTYPGILGLFGELVVWGGTDGNSTFRTGGIYTPSEDFASYCVFTDEPIPGAFTSGNCVIYSLSGFSQQVDLTCMTPTDGICWFTGSAHPASGGIATAPFTIIMDSDLQSGEVAEATMRASSGDLERDYTARSEVQDFELFCDDTSLTFEERGQGITGCGIISLNGFDELAEMDCEAPLESGIACQFSPNPAGSGGTIQTGIGGNGSQVGTWTVNVRAEVRGAFRYFPIEVEVTESRFVVNTLNDTLDTNLGDGNCLDSNGDCSLRAAVLEANALAGFDRIELPDLGGTYELTRNFSGAGEDLMYDLDVTDDVQIVGTGSTRAIIATQLAGRLLEVSGSETEVWLENLELAFGEGDGGGAVLHQGKALYVQDCAFHHNESTTTGGAILSATELHLDRVLIFQNSAATDGGGLLVAGAGTSNTIRDSMIHSNLAGEEGGGIFHTSLFQASTLDIYRSSVSNNSSGTTGGGIHLEAGELTVKNSTLSGNLAQGSGGGLFVTSGQTANLDFATVAFNDADSDSSGAEIGGGIFNDGTVLLRRSIVSDNTAAGSTGQECAGSAGIDLDGLPSVMTTDTDCTAVNGGNRVVGDPDLQTLNYYGGFSLNHALGTTSVALDSAGIGSDCASEDQRGYLRPIDKDGDGQAECDLGAHEVGCTANPTETVTGPISDAVTVKACSSITAGPATVEGAADLTLHAPTVVLEDGFSVDSGGALTVISGLPID